jgi:hypothetical protein
LVLAVLAGKLLVLPLLVKMVLIQYLETSQLQVVAERRTWVLTAALVEVVKVLALQTQGVLAQQGKEMLVVLVVVEMHQVMPQEEAEALVLRLLQLQ